MKYILEIFHQGDCIDRKEYSEPFITPCNGEQVYVSFENKDMFYGGWWIVKKKKCLLFTIAEATQTIQLFCEPDPQQGA